MKKVVLGLLIAFHVVTGAVVGQPGKDLFKIPVKSNGMLKNSIVGSYPQKVDWFNWTGSAWAASGVDQITYNGVGDPLTVTNDLVTGTDVKTTYEYNSFRMPTLILVQNLSGSTWVNIERSRAEYDAWGNVTLEVFEKFDNGSWKMEGGMKFEYELSGGKPVKYTIAHYHPQTQLYNVVSRTTQTYHSNGLIATIMNEVYEGGVWSNSSRVSYTWKSAEEIQSMLMENWETNQWVIYGRYDYTYTTYGSFTAVFNIYEAESSQYIPYLKETSSFDSHGNLTLQTSEAWLGVTWMVLTGSKFDITYQGNNPTQKITQEFDGMQYQNMTKELFSNFLILGKEDLINEPMEFSVYPNPAIDQLNVRFENFPINAPVRVELVDIRGRVVTSGVFQSSNETVTLNIATVPQGNYIVRVSSAEGKFLHKTIIKR